MRLAVIDFSRCQPKKCSYECQRFCPKVRSGVETVKIVDNKPVIVEETCIGCGICAKKCPFNAIKIINLPEVPAEPIFRYGKNKFELFGLPVPKQGVVVGILGQNGIGKTTALRILIGELIPNFGEERKYTLEEVAKRFRGKEIQNYFEKLAKNEIKFAIKPQYVDQIPKFFKGKVRDLLAKVSKNYEKIVKELELEESLDKEISELSGGELQRVAIAACLLKDANFFFFDEPSSFLDIRQRLKVAKILRESAKDKAIIVVEHDLMFLDFVSDVIHVVYGEPGAYGIFCKPKSARNAINEYLNGYLKAENVRFREPIKFDIKPVDRIKEADILLEFTCIEKKLGNFTLKAEAGFIRKGELIGIIGPNSIGKTTFMRILANEIKPDSGEVKGKVKISYKPQYLEAKKEISVYELLNTIDSNFADKLFIKKLEIDRLYEKMLTELSGGELQRVAIAACLLQEADIYLLDEPSAYLDVEQRIRLAKILKDFVEESKKAAFVVDHDLLFIDYISDRLMVFTGVPNKQGIAKICSMREGMNLFLKDLGITFRRDKETNRPRVNKPGSRLDVLQKKKGEYYYFSE